MSFDDLKKILYPAAIKRFLVLTLHLMLDGLIIFRKGDFRRVRSSKLVYKGVIFDGARHLMQTLLKQYYRTV